MTKDQQLDDLAFEFFKDFSRTEYALKASGFHCGEGEAKPNWRDFALVKAVDELTSNPIFPDLKEAINFIINAPPKKQIIVGDYLDWEDVEPNTNSFSHKLLLYICRARNNLFHGGKFNGHWFDPQRSELLLRHSLTILSAVREAVPQVKEAYENTP